MPRGGGLHKPVTVQTKRPTPSREGLHATPRAPRSARRRRRVACCAPLHPFPCHHERIELSLQPYDRDFQRRAPPGGGVGNGVRRAGPHRTVGRAAGAGVVGVPAGAGGMVGGGGSRGTTDAGGRG
eukprot:ctg_497.g160